MSAAASFSDATVFLYAIITSTQCKINFGAVGTVMNLSTGAASMRYKRLKQKLDSANLSQTLSAAKSGLDETSLFLYQCIVASGCQPNWNVVGDATGLSAGAAGMRWRRLQEKIKKDNLLPQLGQTTTTAAKRSVTKPKATNAPKRKRNEPKINTTKSDSDGEHGQKKVKMENDGVAGKRQTRGIKLDLKEIGSNSGSSVAGTSLTTTTTSNYQPTTLEDEVEHDDGSESDDEFETIATKKLHSASLARTPAPRTPVKQSSVKDVKPIQDNARITPNSAAHSIRDNPKPAAAAAPISAATEMPPTPSSNQPGIIPSVESDDYIEVATELAGLPNGRFIKPKKRIQYTSSSSESTDTSESAAESLPPSGATSVHAQASDESTSVDIDDMSSVAPDDSISMAGIPGGLKRKTASVGQRNGIFGKFWGLFAS